MIRNRHVAEWLKSNGFDPNEVTRIALSIEAGSAALLEVVSQRAVKGAPLAGLLAAMQADDEARA